MAKKKLSEEEKEIKRLTEKVSKLNGEIDFLNNQVKEIRQKFEDAGSERAKWKHKALRLEEKVDNLKR